MYYIEFNSFAKEQYLKAFENFNLFFSPNELLDMDAFIGFQFVKQ